MSGSGLYLVTLPLCLLMAHAAWTDVRSRRIANATSLAIMALAPLRMALDWSLQGLVGHLGAGILVFAVTYGLWTARLIGGGDVKLAAALSLHVGLDGVLAFALYTSLWGGLLALVCLARMLIGPIIERARPLAAGADRALASDVGHAAESHSTNSKPTIPYGVAIVGGAACCLLGG